MNDTNLQAYALSKGIKTATRDMTSQEKIGLAMKMFLEKTADYAGNYAKENETLAGSLTTAKAAFSNFLSGVGDASEVGDALIKAGSVIGQKLTALLPTLVSGTKALIEKLIPELPKMFESLLPVVIDGAVALVNGLVSAGGQIADALMGIAPSLVESAILIMETIGSALIDNIDFILDSALQIVMMLGQSLIDNLPKLADAAYKIIDSLGTFIVENAEEILDMGLQILVMLIDGLIAAIPKLADVACSIVEKLGDWIANNAETLVTAAVKLVATLTATLVKQIPKLIKSAAQAVVKALPALLNAFGDMTKKMTALEKLVLAVVAAFVAFKAVSAIVTVINSIKVAFASLSATMAANPIGLVAAAVGGLVSVFGLFSSSAETAEQQMYDFSGEADGLRERMEENREEFEKSTAAIEETAKAMADLNEAYEADVVLIDEETSLVQDLWAELQTLCDETGYVDDANRDRAEYILGELKEALGTEYEMNEGIIGQYQTMQSEIDELIKKRHAERMFKAYEDQYMQAKENQRNLDSELASANDALEVAEEELGTLRAVIRRRKVKKTEEERAAIDAEYAEALETAEENVTAARERVATAKASYDETYHDIYRFEAAEQALLSGDYSSVIALLDIPMQEVDSLTVSSSPTDKDAAKNAIRSAEVGIDYYRESLDAGKPGYTQEGLNAKIDYLNKNLDAYYAATGETIASIHRKTYDSGHGERFHAYDGDTTANSSYDSGSGGGGGADVLHAPVNIDDIIPKTSEGIAVSPVSLADEEKTTMSEIKTSISKLTTAFETLLMNGLIVKMNSREFGRLVRTVKE